MEVLPIAAESRRPVALASLVALGFVAPGVVWAFLDRHVWRWDEAHYAEYTLRTFAAFERGFSSGLAFLFKGIDFKAPGLTWLGALFAPLATFFGRPEPALLCATLAWQAGSLFVCWWSAWRISKSRLTATAVAALVGSAPLFVGMSHQYLVEPLQTFAVSLSFLLALQAHRMSGEALIVALSAVAAFAMAAKSTSPLYCALPLAYAAVSLGRRRSITAMRHLRLLRVPLLALSILSLGLVALWYAIYGVATLSNVWRSTYGSLAAYYGVPGAFLTKFGFWAGEFASALLVKNAALGIIVVLSAVAAWGIGRRTRGATGERAAVTAPEKRAIQFTVVAAMLTLCAAFVVYSSQTNDDSRFLEPLFPASAIVVAWLCTIRWQRILSASLLSVATVQFALTYAHALGYFSAPGVQHRWLWMVERDDTARQELQTVVQLTCDRRSPHEVSMIGADLDWLSPLSANFYATAAYGGEAPCRYTGLPYAATDVAAGLEWLYGSGAKYFVAVRPDVAWSPPDAFNVVTAPVFAHVEASSEWKRAHTVGSKIVVFRRRRLS